MTEEFPVDAIDDSYAPIEGIDADEFEEISSDEVDRVVSVLEELIPTVESENIKSHLEEAMNSIYFLVYDESDQEEELELDDGEAMTEAA